MPEADRRIGGAPVPDTTTLRTARWSRPSGSNRLAVGCIDVGGSRVTLAPSRSAITVRVTVVPGAPRSMMPMQASSLIGGGSNVKVCCQPPSAAVVGVEVVGVAGRPWARSRSQVTSTDSMSISAAVRRACAVTESAAPKPWPANGSMISCWSVGHVAVLRLRALSTPTSTGLPRTVPLMTACRVPSRGNTTVDAIEASTSVSAGSAIVPGMSLLAGKKCGSANWSSRSCCSDIVAAGIASGANDSPRSHNGIPSQTSW